MDFEVQVQADWTSCASLSLTPNFDPVVLPI
jgi:hypothetical protein